MAEVGKPILCVGALTLDTIFQLKELPAGPGKFLPSAAVEVAAGMATSAATAIARLGGTAALWASVGSDATGRRLIHEIETESVDCSAVRTVKGARSAFATILVDGRGDRIIVPRYDPDLLSEPKVVPRIAAGAYAAVMADVRWPAASALALSAGRAVGIPAILDADTASPETLGRLLPLASHIVASQPAAEHVTGLSNPVAMVRSLAARYNAFVAVTAGATGVFWHDSHHDAVVLLEPPSVAAIDTLAAGDIFHGAFALGLVEGMAMQKLMSFAATAAAIKCETFGGRLGAPDRPTVIARMGS